MREPNDLPLFSWKPPQCLILPFPPSKEIARVRRTALTLATGTERQIAHNRAKIFAGVENRLLAIGLAPAIAAAERVKFEQTVADEMRRLGLGSFIPRPDGAA